MTHRGPLTFFLCTLKPVVTKVSTNLRGESPPCPHPKLWGLARVPFLQPLGSALGLRVQWQLIRVGRSCYCCSLRQTGALGRAPHPLPGRGKL